MLGESGLGECFCTAVDFVDCLAYEGGLKLVLVNVLGSGLVLIELGFEVLGGLLEPFLVAGGPVAGRVEVAFLAEGTVATEVGRIEPVYGGAVVEEGPLVGLVLVVSRACVAGEDSPVVEGIGRRGAAGRCLFPEGAWALAGGACVGRDGRRWRLSRRF